MRTVEVEGRVYEVLFQGYRGSHCLGLNDDASDEDFLLVANTLDRLEERNVDSMVVNLQDFVERVLRCELEAVEALFHKVYITNEFRGLYEGLLGVITHAHALSDAKLKYKLFRAVRNQYKLYERYLKLGDEAKAKKHLAKVYLFITLVDSDDALSCFIDHRLDAAVVARYRSLKYAATVEEVATYAAGVRSVGKDKAVREARKTALWKQVEALQVVGR